MKILGISYGTVNGNNDAMCKQALMAAKEAGAEVEFIQMQKLHIEHCTGCIACVKAMFGGKGNLCVLKDDFAWLMDKMYDADGIISSVPIFEKGATGLFHTITDRFGPRMDRGNNVIADKLSKEHGGPGVDSRYIKDKVVSFMAIGGSDWATRVQVDCAMQALTPMWKVIDNDYFMWSKGILMNDEALERAAEIGRNIVEAAKDVENAQYKGEPGVCPHCHSKEFHIDPVQNKAICDLCGMIGDLEKVDGKYQFVYPEEQLGHAHDTLPGKFIHGDDIQRNEGALMEMQKTEEFKARKKKYMDFIQPILPEK